MNYSESLEHLFALQRLGARPGLRVITDLLARVGDPQKAFPCVLVAGTNGKGSTAAFLDSILRAAGIRTGLYTSPHLVRFEERITVDGAMIPQDEVARITTLLCEQTGRMASPDAPAERPTFFECATAMAFLHFRDRKVEVAVLEVGMGGRLDATNAVDPVTALFTPIDLDHREHLGDTLDAIAREKAGILKPGGRAITAPQAPEALVVLRRAASVRGATLLELDQIWRIGEGAEGSLDLVPRSETGIRLEGIRLPLAGRHQRVNAALAAAAATRLPDFRARIGAEAIRKGLSEARWPGRCELVASDPDVLLDGAHNPAGARALRHHLVETYTSKGRQVVLVFGAMADKDLSAMMESLLPCAKRVFLTRAETPRAADPMALEAIARLYHPSVVRAPSLSAALFAAREEAGPAGVVCVTGSLYLVGDALALHEGIEPRVRMAL